MKRFLCSYALVATLAVFVAIQGWHRTHTRTQRLTANQHTLFTLLDAQHDTLAHRTASVEALRLRCREFAQLRAADADTIRRLGIRLHRLEALARQVSRTSLDIATPLYDTVRIVRRDTTTLFDTLRRFRWRDAWVTLEGEIERDTVHCRLRSVDTLRQTLHRVPHRFLFFRWGTKAIRQEIHTSNPHTQLIYADYILIER